MSKKTEAYQIYWYYALTDLPAQGVNSCGVAL